MEAMGFGNRTGLARENLAPLLRDSGRSMALKALYLAGGLLLAASPVKIEKAEAQMIVPYGAPCPWGTYPQQTVYLPNGGYGVYCAPVPVIVTPYPGYYWGLGYWGYSGYWGGGWVGNRYQGHGEFRGGGGGSRGERRR